MARSRVLLCSQLFLIFLALISTHVSENTLGSLRSGPFHSRLNSGGHPKGIPPQKQYACLWKHVCHLGSFPRGKGYFTSRVHYYSDLERSFQLIPLIVSGDIQGSTLTFQITSQVASGILDVFRCYDNFSLFTSQTG